MRLHPHTPKPLADRPLLPTHPQGDVSTRDWRAQAMADAAKKFYSDAWSRGNTAPLEGLLAPEFIYRDAVWAPRRMVVGAPAFRALVESVRQAYPDMYTEIEHVRGGGGFGGRGRRGGRQAAPAVCLPHTIIAAPAACCMRRSQRVRDQWGAPMV